MKSLVSSSVTFPDRSGPRFNGKRFRKKIVDRNLYIKWKDRRISEGKAIVDYVTFFRTWRMIAREMIQGIIDERDGLLMPMNVGSLFIGYASTKKPIDYKTSREIGKVVYHENYDTDGKLVKVMYDYSSPKYKIRYHNMWGFISSTLTRRLVSDSVRENPERYKNTKYQDWSKPKNRFLNDYRTGNI